VGFAVGLFHRSFLRRYGHPSALGAGLATILVIAGCGVLQYRYDRAEAPLRREVARLREQERTRLELEARVIAYRAVRNALLLIGSPANAASVGPLLDRAAPILDRGTAKAEFQRLRGLAQEASGRELTAEELAEFRSRAIPLAAALQRELRKGYRAYRAGRSSRLPLRLQREVLTGPLVRRAPSR
jgi:hypothetical protein